ncbi:MAG: gamma-glutamyltransferase [Gammaproteobacteria bacterium]
MLLTAACAAITLLATLPSARAYDRINGKMLASRSPVLARHAMAATSQPLAVQAALEIMREGGNAVDAAIAMNATLGVVEPTGAGVGGDLFAIVWDAKTKQLYGLNSSGPSPKSLTLAWFRQHGYQHIPPHGPLPVTVPGTVGGWFALHARFGKLPMKKILAPAIRYAREGYPVTQYIAYDWKLNAEVQKKFDNFRKTFMPGGRAPDPGEVFHNPDLANTLTQIAKGGRDAFYKGRIAHTIADYIHEQGGFLSYEDLASYEPEWVKPVSTSYRGYDVWELPPNGQGIATLQMLNILEGYDLGRMGFGSPEYIHTLVEAKKLVYADRARFYSDPRFNKLPIQGLISKKYAEQRRKLIDPEHASKGYAPGDPPALATDEHGDTTYMTAADNEGNMVSLIQSNYRGMGSGMVPPGLGFDLQDRGELFSLNPDDYNAFAPGKRPFHTIIPSFVTKDGKPWMSFGVMGGAMQPQGQTEVLINMIDFGMNVQEAGDAPRIRHAGSPQPTGEAGDPDGGTVYLESGFPPETLRELTKMGHHLSTQVDGYGGYQAIRYDAKHHVYWGASESRKDGHAAGY